MKYVSIQIGNSDGKLSQVEWSEFVLEMQKAIERHASQIHFFGGSVNWAKWQNACWVLEVGESEILRLRNVIAKTRDHYNQDSACWLEGKAEFI